ncbi:MAG: hypothetical protein CSA54_00465 [Gammaproteobacteria bacterium]|nr:MAG: hypothetical protein CSA54_00465 [Gammaproteobacteria bacterium]
MTENSTATETAPTTTASPLLDVKNLDVVFHTNTGDVHAVKNISFELNAGETLAIVGESGSGKSVTAMSVIKLLPHHVTEYGSESCIAFNGDNLLKKDESFLRNVRGNKIAFIFQEPMTSLNPYMKIGKQLAEALIEHGSISKAEAKAQVIDMLSMVGIKEPEKRINTYPHEFSGGQLQRIMIAMALLNKPDILIADEPTTALDVTIQAEILDLIHDLQEKMGMAIIFITHDLGLAKHYAKRVCVMRLGEIVERGDIEAEILVADAVAEVEVVGAPAGGRRQGRLLRGGGDLGPAGAETLEVALGAGDLGVDAGELGFDRGGSGGVLGAAGGGGGAQIGAALGLGLGDDGVELGERLVLLVHSDGEGVELGAGGVEVGLGGGDDAVDLGAQRAQGRGGIAGLARHTRDIGLQQGVCTLPVHGSSRSSPDGTILLRSARRRKRTDPDRRARRR